MSQWQIFDRPEGRDGTNVALFYMAQFARDASITPEIRLNAIRICDGVNQQDYLGEIAALTVFVRDYIRYIRDIKNVETLALPIETLTMRAGDCDDKSCLLASFLLSIGFNVRFAVLKRNSSFCHVWVQAQSAGKWVNCETCLPIPPLTSPPLKNSDKVYFYDA
jgi:hypothetical protein